MKSFQQHHCNHHYLKHGSTNFSIVIFVRTQTCKEYSRAGQGRAGQGSREGKQQQQHKQVGIKYKQNDETNKNNIV